MDVGLCSVSLLLALALATVVPGAAITSGTLQGDLPSSEALASLSHTGTDRQLLTFLVPKKGNDSAEVAEDDDDAVSSQGAGGGKSEGSENNPDKKEKRQKVDGVNAAGTNSSQEDGLNSDESSQEFTWDELLATMRIPEDSKILYFEDGKTCNSTAGKELKKMCYLLNIDQRCPLVSSAGGVGLNDTLFLSKCQGGNCRTVWSERQSACFLEGLSPSPSFIPNSGNLTCGIPQPTWDLFNLSPAPLVETQPGTEDGISCGLGFSGGVEILRHLECVDGTPRLTFHYDTAVVAPKGAEYYCILDNHCDSDEPYVFICYITPEEEAGVEKEVVDDDDLDQEGLTLRQKMAIFGIPEDVDIMYFRDGASCQQDVVPEDVNEELTKVCKFIELGQKCAPRGAQDSLFSSTCIDGRCVKIWSHQQTKCILEEWGFELSNGSDGDEGESDEGSVCGLPETTWKTLRTPVPLLKVTPEQEGHVSCGLGLPVGVQINRFLDCLNDGPILVFEYETDKEMFPSGLEYICTFDTQCNISAQGVFPGFSMCYSEADASIVNGTTSLQPSETIPGQLALLEIPTGAEVVFLNDSQPCEHTDPGKKIRRELRSVCNFMSVSSRCCCDTEASDRGTTGHIVATCKDGICKDIWSREQTLCFLRETRHDVGDDDNGIQGSEAASPGYVCGLPANTWHALHQGLPLYTIPLEMEDELACSLALPRGATMEMQLNCISKKPRLQITAHLEHSLAERDAEYKCIFFDGTCNESNDFLGSNVCYLKPENESANLTLRGDDVKNLGSVNAWSNGKGLFFGLLLSSMLLAVIML